MSDMRDEPTNPISVKLDSDTFYNPAVLFTAKDRHSDMVFRVVAVYDRIKYREDYRSDGVTKEYVPSAVCIAPGGNVFPYPLTSLENAKPGGS